MTIVSQRERVNKSVEADRQQGAGNEELKYENAREECAAFEKQKMFEVGDHRKAGQERQRDADEVLVGERPAEEAKIRPEVEQLWCVNCRHMVRFVPEDDAPVDQNEGAKSGDQSDERLQDSDNVDQPLGLGEQFQRARDDGNHSFSIVCTKSELAFRV